MAFTHFYHQRFLFRDHGFDLVSISFIGFLTLLGQQQVANAALPDATIGLRSHIAPACNHPYREGAAGHDCASTGRLEADKLSIGGRRGRNTVVTFEVAS